MDLDVVYVDLPNTKPVMSKEDIYTKMVTVDLPVLKKGTKGKTVKVFRY